MQTTESSIIKKILASGPGDKWTLSEELDAAVNAALLSDTVLCVSTGLQYVSAGKALNLS